MPHNSDALTRRVLNELKNDGQRPTAHAHLYPGGKAGPGVAQRIINLIPPHGLYVEPFAGAAAVYLRKRPAAQSILIERDPAAALALQRLASDTCTVITGDAIAWLHKYHFPPGALVYCDPPYMRPATNRRRMYRYEFSDDDHQLLLAMLRGLRCLVILSGYRTPLYDSELCDWHRIDFKSATRRGPRDESLWTNYQPPQIPADLAYVGANFRERERIKRKARRWRANFAALPPAERAAIARALFLESSPPAPITDPAPAAVQPGGIDTASDKVTQKNVLTMPSRRPRLTTCPK